MTAQDALNQEAYAALTGEFASEVGIIRTPDDLEQHYWRITKALRLGRIVEVSVKEVDRP